MAGMTEVRIRNLDEWVTAWWKLQARLHGRSLQKELRELLTERARSNKRQLADRLLSDLDDLERRHGVFAGGTQGIRAERESRG